VLPTRKRISSCHVFAFGPILFKGIEKLRAELERNENLRKTTASKEQDSLERLQSQIQAEQKLKAGECPLRTCS
jgi:hypothetical protein